MYVAGGIITVRPIPMVLYGYCDRDVRAVVDLPKQF